MISNRTIARVLMSAVAFLGGSQVSEVAGQMEPQSVTGHVEFVNAAGNHIRYSVSAVRHHDGSVSGEIEEHATAADGAFIRRGHGTVTCLTITGNIARIGGVVDQIRGAGAPVGSEAFLTVIDNGEGPKDPPDAASVPLAGPPGSATTHCTTGISRPTFPIERGNIQIRPSGL